MADASPIEWTDATWNIVTGCSVVSPGCTNCYAMRLAGTRLRDHPSRTGLTVDSKAGPVWNGQVRFNAEWLTQPLRWTKPRRIFVAAHGDLFHDGVTDDQLDQIFAVMALCPQHTFQILTKRPERMRAYLDMACGRIADTVIAMRRRRGDTDMVVVPLGHVRPGAAWWPLPNVWLGVSVEDQTRADERIPVLLATPAAVRWISAEPLLGPVDLTRLSTMRFQGAECLNALTGALSGMFGDFCPLSLPPVDWVIVGGESGPHARPMHPDWARQLRDQCAAAGVPFLFKQWGEWIDWQQFGATRWENTTPQRKSYRGPCVGRFHGGEQHFSGPFETRHESGLILARRGKKASGRLLDGRLHDGFPGGC